MEELHLDHNGIGIDGATGLLGAMQMTEDSRKGRGLRRVWLHGNDGVPEELNARVHAIARRNAGAAGEILEQIPRDDLAALEAWEDDVAMEAEGEAVKAGGGSLPGGFKETSTLFANRVAAAAAAAYRRWFPDHAANTRGTAVIAAIVAHERDASSPFDAPGHGDRLRVLSLGSGTKFMPREVAAAAAAGVRGGGRASCTTATPRSSRVARSCACATERYWTSRGRPPPTKWRARRRRGGSWSPRVTPEASGCVRGLPSTSTSRPRRADRAPCRRWRAARPTAHSRRSR